METHATWLPVSCGLAVRPFKVRAASARRAVRISGSSASASSAMPRRDTSGTPRRRCAALTALMELFPRGCRQYGGEAATAAARLKAALHALTAWGTCAAVAELRQVVDVGALQPAYAYVRQDSKPKKVVEKKRHCLTCDYTWMDR